MRSSRSARHGVNSWRVVNRLERARPICSLCRQTPSSDRTDPLKFIARKCKLSPRSRTVEVRRAFGGGRYAVTFAVPSCVSMARTASRGSTSSPRRPACPCPTCRSSSGEDALQLRTLRASCLSAPVPMPMCRSHKGHRSTCRHPCCARMMHDNRTRSHANPGCNRALIAARLHCRVCQGAG